ncbi:TetR/AcrR family transcriptional regulator [Sphingomonas sp.]|jgi:AcrR family transcriptional regulator|uniref:TetR/AcrR family transcriptional regulator n=1 Tax=Sphingomonas sp. TaxID=28214 RepID=UPI00356AA43A
MTYIDEMTRTPRSGPRSLTARGAATRARIVDAAADLIYAHGVDRTSLDEVMARSGVSKSQLYHYFKDKDALVLDVIAVQTDRVIGAQQPHLGALDSLDALRAWRQAILDLNQTVDVGGCPLGSLANEMANNSEDARARLASSFARWADAIEQGLATMQARGDLAASADPHTLATGLLSAVQGGLLLAKTEQSNRPLEIAIDMALAHIASHSTNAAP